MSWLMQKPCSPIHCPHAHTHKKTHSWCPVPLNVWPSSADRAVWLLWNWFFLQSWGKYIYIIKKMMSRFENIPMECPKKKKRHSRFHNVFICYTQLNLIKSAVCPPSSVMAGVLAFVWFSTGVRCQGGKRSAMIISMGNLVSQFHYFAEKYDYIQVKKNI